MRAHQLAEPVGFPTLDLLKVVPTMSVFRWIFTQIYLWLERIKGHRRMVDVTKPDVDPFTMTSQEIGGYQITIYCHKRTYRQEYALWYIPGKDYASYSVSATVSHDAPARLKKACELEVSFPAFFNDLVDDRTQKKIAINAYLDLLNQRMRRG